MVGLKREQLQPYFILPPRQVVCYTYRMIKAFWLFFVCFLFSVFTSCATAPMAMHEADYVDLWCKGEIEVTLKDGTRCDCLTDEYAIEYEFAPGWAEAIGQSLHYARMTGRKPGIVLILRRASDERYMKRLKPLADEAGITVWTQLQ